MSVAIFVPASHVSVDERFYFRGRLPHSRENRNVKRQAVAKIGTGKRQATAKIATLIDVNWHQLTLTELKKAPIFPYTRWAPP